MWNQMYQREVIDSWHWVRDNETQCGPIDWPTTRVSSEGEDADITTDYAMTSAEVECRLAQKQRRQAASGLWSSYQPGVAKAPSAEQRAARSRSASRPPAFHGFAYNALLARPRSASRCPADPITALDAASLPGGARWKVGPAEASVPEPSRALRARSAPPSSSTTARPSLAVHFAELVDSYCSGVTTPPMPQDLTFH